MKRIAWFTLLLLAGFVSGLQAGEIDRIKAKGEIVISLNKGYPPFSMTVENQLIGLDVELGRLLADYLNVKPRFILPDLYKDQIPRLLAGESDIIIAAMTRTIERGLQVNFTDPYWEVSQAALVDRALIGNTDDSYFDLVDIRDIKVGVKANTTIERFARELFPTEAIKTFPGHPQAAEAMVNGEVDAMVADSPFIQVWAQTHPELEAKFKAMLSPVTKEHYGFAIRKGDPEFLNWLNLFITQVKIDGTMDLLAYKYFMEMPWLAGKKTREAKITRAQLMRNRFVAKKRAAMEQKMRTETLQLGDAYE